VARHSDKRASAVESVTVSESLVVCRSAAGPARFVVTCDDVTLRWLASAFRALGRGRTFVIGDGLPIGSDGDCVIAVGVTEGGRAPETPGLAPGVYRWLLPEDEARRFAGLLAGMAAFSGPCHQYLETGPGLPAVLVSKGEYGGQMLRRMRGPRA
jgi:hypothetical protein